MVADLQFFLRKINTIPRVTNNNILFSLRLIFDSLGRPGRRKLALTSLFLIFLAVTSGVTPLLLKSVIDAFEKSANQFSTTVALAIFVYSIAIFVNHGLGLIQWIVYSIAEKELCIGLSQRIFPHWWQSPEKNTSTRMQLKSANRSLFFGGG